MNTKMTDENNSEEKKIMINRLNLESKRQHDHDRDQWTCCCTDNPTDPTLIRYCAQLFFGFMISAFSMYQLSNSTKCEDVTLYSSLLTGTVAIFLPAPRN